MRNRTCIFRANGLLTKLSVMMIALHFSAEALAQTSVIMEACNSISDNGKRLICFKQIESLTVAGPKNTNSLATIKNSFAAIAGAVDSGISYANYKILILEPAKALGVFKQENPGASRDALESFDKAVMAYNDAERLWNASIYKSRDSGVFGPILNYEAVGLTDVVRRYRLTTTTVLLNPHVQIESALPQIWRYAARSYKDAFEIMEPARSEEVINRVACKVGSSAVMQTTLDMCRAISGTVE